MGKPVSRARAVLDAWREQGADRHDAMRFYVMDALEKRALRHEGEARRLLDERLCALVDAYAVDLKRAGPSLIDVQAGDANSPFAELIDQLAVAAAARGSRQDGEETAPAISTPPEMPLLGEFRQIWTSVRTESQLRQSMEQAPENSGPLNSRALVHRAMTMMRDASPAYLQHFLAYIDDLAWLEQMSGSMPVAGKDAAPPTKSRKRTRERTRNE
jgi:hypothetical protein